MKFMVEKSLQKLFKSFLRVFSKKSRADINLSSHLVQFTWRKDIYLPFRKKNKDKFELLLDSVALELTTYQVTSYLPLYQKQELGMVWRIGPGARTLLFWDGFDLFLDTWLWGIAVLTTWHSSSSICKLALSPRKVMIKCLPVYFMRLFGNSR